MRVLALILATALLSACKHPITAPVTAVGPQANLLRCIADADRVVITNRFAESSRPELNFTVCVSGRRVDTIIRAVAYGQPLVGIGTHCIYDRQVQFFKGTNCLGQVNFQGSFFWDGKTEYADNTGVMEKLYDKMVNRARLRELRLQGRL